MLQEQRHSIFPPKFKYVVMKHAFIKYQYFAILDCQREKGETKKKKTKNQLQVVIKESTHYSVSFAF